MSPCEDSARYDFCPMPTSSCQAESSLPIVDRHVQLIRLHAADHTSCCVSDLQIDLSSVLEQMCMCKFCAKHSRYRSALNFINVFRFPLGIQVKSEILSKKHFCIYFDTKSFACGSNSNTLIGLISAAAQSRHFKVYNCSIVCLKIDTIITKTNLEENRFFSNDKHKTSPTDDRMAGQLSTTSCPLRRLQLDYWSLVNFPLWPQR